MADAKPTEQVAHGAYLIEPTPHHLNGTGPWTQWLQIARADPGGEVRVQLFNGPATFPTRVEAAAHTDCAQKRAHRLLAFLLWIRSRTLLQSVT